MRRSLVLAVLVVLACVLPAAVSCVSAFGCSTGGFNAHADSPDCPSSIEQAATDARWAKQQESALAPFVSKTRGVLFVDATAATTLGESETFSSGDDDDAKAARQLLQQYGLVDRVGGIAAADHAEVKAALYMRNNKIPRAVMVINNPLGVCAGPYSCTRAIPVILPANYTLWVWSPGSTSEPDVFSGRG